MTDRSPGLYLVTPALADPASFLPDLEAALAATPVEAVLVRLLPADERTLINRVKALAAVAQAREAAVIVADPGGIDLPLLVSRGGADGAHTTDLAGTRDLRARLGADRALGAGGLRTRHDAMSAGEAGVDYVLFGEPRPDGSVPAGDETTARAAWWAEIFQVPCVAWAADEAALPSLARTGAEFVAVADLVWSGPDGPAAGLRRVADALSEAVS